MNDNPSKKLTGIQPIINMFIFLISVLIIYGIIFAFMPDKIFLALKSTVNIFQNIIYPLISVFIIMLLFNLFVKPGQVAKFLGYKSGFKGVILATVAGIISMGPIFAWYPLLKELKEKGAGNAPVAVFLYNRAIKLPLLAIMVSYFGWEYVVILSVFTILGSFAIGYSINVLMK